MVRASDWYSQSLLTAIRPVNEAMIRASDWYSHGLGGGSWNVSVDELYTAMNPFPAM